MARFQVRFSLTLQDARGLTESCTAYVSVEDTLPPGDLQATFARWVEHVTAVSDGKVVSARMSGKAAAVPDQPDKPPAHAKIEVTGLLRFTLLNVANRSWSLAVPAFAHALVGKGMRVDATNPALRSLMEEMSTGGAGYSFTDPNNIPLGRPRDVAATVRPGSANKQLRDRRRMQ